MLNSDQQRVAPIIALLFILLGIISLIYFNTAAFNDFFLNTNQEAQASVEPAATQITASKTPTSTPNPQNEYDVHRNRDELQIALYHLEAESAFNGWTAQSHIRAGNLWRDMGDLGRALPHWEAANTEESNANLLRQIADIYLERGEWGIAWQRIQTLLELAPNDSWALYHGGLILAPSDPVSAFGYLGQVAALNNDYSETAQNTLDAIGNTETNSDVILRVGATLASAEEWSLAENAYQYAADIYFPFPEATAYIGLMRIFQGKNGERQISEAIALDNSNPDIHYIAGVYWRSAGEYLKSEEAFIDALLLEPYNPTYHAELGNTYRAMGNPLDAEVWLQTAVIISGNDPVMVEALNNFYENEAYLNTQSISGISSNLSNAQDPSVLSASGWVRHIQGDTAGGLALIEQALEIDPDNPRALFDKARIYLQTDRVDEAIPLLEQVANGNSAFASPAQELLDQQE